MEVTDVACHRAGEGARLTRRGVLTALGTSFAVTAAAEGREGGTATVGGEWPMFQRTVANTGRGSEGGGVRKPVGVRWTVDVGTQLWSAPVVADGTVVVGSRDGTLSAYGVRDGAEQWHYRAGDPLMATPVISDGRVFVPVHRGQGAPSLLAVAIADGTVQWEGPSTMRWPGITATGGVVYVRGRDRVWAIEGDSGSVLWQTDASAFEAHAPAVAGDTIYVGGTEGRIHALAAPNGTERWRAELPGAVDSAPTYADGTVVAESGDIAGRITALDAADGDEQWHASIHRHGIGSPAVADGTVYTASQERWIYAFDATDGTRIWRTRNEGVQRSSPAVVDDTVYVGSVDNAIYALATEDGHTRWKHELSDWVVTSPAVVDGTVFVGSRDGTLYALEQRGNALPIPGFGTIGALLGAGAVAGYRFRKSDAEQ